MSFDQDTQNLQNAANRASQTHGSGWGKVAEETLGTYATLEFLRLSGRTAEYNALQTLLHRSWVFWRAVLVAIVLVVVAAVGYTAIFGTYHSPDEYQAPVCPPASTTGFTAPGTPIGCS